MDCAVGNEGWVAREREMVLAHRDRGKNRVKIKERGNKKVLIKFGYLKKFLFYKFRVR